MYNEDKVNKKIRQKMKGSNYISLLLGECIIGNPIMHAPKLSLECAKKLIILFIDAFIVDCGFENAEMGNLGLVTANTKQITSVILEETIDMILT